TEISEWISLVLSPSLVRVYQRETAGIGLHTWLTPPHLSVCLFLSLSLSLCVVLISVYYQVSLLWSHTTHNITHVHFLGGDTGHTHTHACRRGRSEICPLHLSLPGLSFLQGSQEQWAGCGARGPSEVNCPSLVRDGHVFCCFACFFLLGFLVEETPCGHGENMQTPHRKAREIAHLSTVHSGEDLLPRANSAPCRNQTHDLLAVRQQCKQCKQLSHRAPYT